MQPFSIVSHSWTHSEVQVSSQAEGIFVGEKSTIETAAISRTVPLRRNSEYKHLLPVIQQLYADVRKC